MEKIHPIASLGITHHALPAVVRKVLDFRGIKFLLEGDHGSTV